MTMQIASAVMINTIQSAYGVFHDIALVAFWIGVTLPRRRQGRMARRVEA